MNDDRIIQRLDKMVATGQMTEDEANRLRATEGTPEFESVMRDIRVRHASVRIDAAVSAGEMGEEEAVDLLDRLKDGEHPRGLRARLARHRPPRRG